MADNPYSAPLTGPPKRIADDIPGTLRHRVFRNRRWLVFSPKGMLEHVRKDVEIFVDQQIGVENVVSICEKVYSAEIVVWYRSVS